jgi:hypothetical protein
LFLLLNFEVLSFFEQLAQAINLMLIGLEFLEPLLLITLPRILTTLNWSLAGLITLLQPEVSHVTWAGHSNASSLIFLAFFWIADIQ